MASATLCGKCETTIKRNENYVVCSGWCENYFHGKCEGLKEEEIKYINTRNFIGWFCPNCVEKKGVLSRNILENISETIIKMKCDIKKQTETMEEQEKLIAELISTMNTNKNEIQMEIEKTINVIENQDSGKSSYASKAKANKHEPVIIIKPKNSGQSNITTKEEVKKNFDPSKLEISGLRNISKGGVVLECRNKDKINEVKEEVSKKLGENYDISLPKKRSPKLKIIGLTENLSASEMREKILAQNTFLDVETANIKVLHVQQSKNRNANYFAYVEVDGPSYIKILREEKLNIGWDRCRVYEAVGVTRCYKCSGFNHKATECRSEKACPRCAGPHDLRECKADNDKIRCINCVKTTDKLKIKLDAKHEAWNSEQCAVYKRKLEFEKNKIDFLE